MRELSAPDRVGMGWRRELGPAILSSLGEIDVLEVIVDDYMAAPRGELRSLQTLSAQVPLVYHGVGLGLASALPVEEARLSKLARTLDRLGAETWSEHLAFVRAGGREIGHLAAPPRTRATIDGTLSNLERIRNVVGSLPVLENIATLLEPPGSRMSEPEWVGEIAAASGAGLLLDLHNLYANAVNFGREPLALLREFPLAQVRMVHLSGGKWIQEPAIGNDRPRGTRLLDDHVHDVPEPVFALLAEVAKLAPHPLTVILERDGEYPEFEALLSQLRKARAALARGRAARLAEAAS